jgi:GNAT superfamily N-acetyltransferase
VNPGSRGSNMLITVETPLMASPRLRQLEGLFDLPAATSARRRWHVELPLDQRPWQVGLVVGPSGCGKSTIARNLWPEALAAPEPWPIDRAVVDAFPDRLSIKEIALLLSAVGFSSPPAWRLPYHALSTGQQYRAELARLLAGERPLTVCDEYTSVVDRTVAQVGSHALQRTVRNRGQRFIAVTCHEDVEAWLDPDWVYRPAEDQFAWRLLRRRPVVSLDIVRVGPEAWRLFRAHHYLSAALHPAALCFLAQWSERPVAFSAWLPQLTRRGGKREHRTVVLPDFQGVGIGHALSSRCAAHWRALGFRVTSTTTHPAFVAARARDPHWRLARRPSLLRPERGRRHAVARLTAGFEYVGPPALLPFARREPMAPKPDSGMPR